MKVIIAGSRTITDYKHVEEAAKLSKFEISEVVSGTAPGVDRLGELYGHELTVGVKRFPADWKTHGKNAGPIRNRVMAEYAEALIAVWDGKSVGTKNMIDTARELSLRVFVHEVRE